MNAQTAINLTKIMANEGIRQITRREGGFNVLLSHDGGVLGFGRTVGEAFNDALAQIERRTA